MRKSEEWGGSGKVEWSNRSRKLASVGLAAAMALSLLAGCAAKRESKSDAGAAQEITEVRLGAVFPVTGKESKIGGAFKVATEFAIKEVNDAGGLAINGKKVPVRLALLDDTTDPTKSAQLVEQLITQEKVHTIIGGYSTLLVQAQTVVPERYGIPYITGGGAATNTYGRSKWVFGTLSPVEVLAKTQMEYLKDLMDAGKLPKPGTVALVWENTEHGKDYQKGVQDFAKANPQYFKIVMDEGFELYAPDFKPLLTKVQNARADLLMADSHLEDYISMHRTYTQMGMYHKMLTHGARGADKAARDALGVATDYVFASGWWTPLLPYPQVRAFNEKWKAAQGGATPQWYDAMAYETTRALLKAIQNAGSLKPEKIRDALANLEMRESIVPGGVLRFSPTGQAVYPFVVTQNKPGGKLDLVWPKGDKTGDSIAPIPQER